MIYDYDNPEHPVRVIIEDDAFSICIGRYNWHRRRDGFLSKNTLKYLIQMLFSFEYIPEYDIKVEEHYLLSLVIRYSQSKGLEIESTYLDNYMDIEILLNEIIDDFTYDKEYVV